MILPIRHPFPIGLRGEKSIDVPSLISQARSAAGLWDAGLDMGTEGKFISKPLMFIRIALDLWLCGVLVIFCGNKWWKVGRVGKFIRN